MPIAKQLSSMMLYLGHIEFADTAVLREHLLRWSVWASQDQMGMQNVMRYMATFSCIVAFNSMQKHKERLGPDIQLG